MELKPFEKKVWLSSPTMHGEELEYVQDAYNKNWMSTVGENINEVEKISCKKVGCKYAVGLASGTSALHLAMKLAGIKQGDKVVVIAGKDKGKEGKVIQTLKAQDKVIVEGVNIVKKHIKPNGGQDGRIAEVEAPLHVSNVMIIDPKTKKGTKVGYTTDKNGKKIRVSRKSNEKLD